MGTENFDSVNVTVKRLYADGDICFPAQKTNDVIDLKEKSKEKPVCDDCNQKMVKKDGLYACKLCEPNKFTDHKAIF